MKARRHSVRVFPIVWTLLLAAPVGAQDPPFDQFIGTYEVVQSTMPAPDAEIIYHSVAEDNGIHSVWRHGEGSSFYEAHALWGYESETGEVKVLEINSRGLVALHIGSFADEGVLKVQRFADDGRRVLERREFWWSHPDTLEMAAEFMTGIDTTRHRVTVARK